MAITGTGVLSYVKNLQGQAKKSSSNKLAGSGILPSILEEREKERKLNETKTQLQTMTGGNISDEQVQAFMDSHTINDDGTWISNEYKQRAQDKLLSNRAKTMNGALDPLMTFEDAYRNYGATSKSNGAMGQVPYNGANIQGASMGNTNPYNTEEDYIKGEYERQAELQRRLIAKQVAQGTSRYESEKEGVNQDYDEMARQAYIANMQQGRQMPQQLVARGINGGGVETANLGLRVGYENNRNAIESNRNNAIGAIDNAIVDLQNTGDLQMAQQALDLYQQQIAAEAKARENAKQEFASTATGYGDDYQAKINEYLAKGYSPDSYEVRVLSALRQQKIQAQQQAEAQALATAQAEAQKQANLDRNYNLDYMKTMNTINNSKKESKPKTVEEQINAIWNDPSVTSYGQMATNLKKLGLPTNVLQAYLQGMGASANDINVIISAM
jgi:hypothetical protein